MTDSKTQKNRIFKTSPDGQTRIEDRPDSGDVRPGTLQDMSFSTHILSLNAMALMHLGEVDGVPFDERDLDAAQHIIDTLKMLQEKTEGNLTDHEAHLLKTLIYDLHVKFLKARG